MSKSLSIFSALICTIIWGTTFIAQDTGMRVIGPYVFNGVRFFVGFLVLIPFYLLLEKKNTYKEVSKNKNKFIYLSILIGLFLFLGTVFQQVALLYTDVANAAFFTIFYVPMVPIIVFFLFKKNIHWSVWPSVILCVIGGYLLSNFNDAMVRMGDTLVVLGAVFWSLNTNSLCWHTIRRNCFCTSNICTKKYLSSTCGNYLFFGRCFCNNCSLDYFEPNIKY